MDSSSTRLIPKSSQKLPNAWACKIAPVHNRSLRGAGPSGPAVELALTTFAILVLELALIRWLGTQIRIAAYFANLVLVATFLGMGLGVGQGEASGLSRWGIPALAIVSIVLAASGPLGLMHLTFPDPAIALWDRAPTATWAQFVGSALVVTACFWCVAAIFMLLGTRVGHLFDQLPPLRAYAVDLGGSLLGVLAMALAAALWATPPVWIALGVLPLVWIHRDALSVVAAGIAIAAAAISIDGARFSPYNRIDLTQAVELDPDSPPPPSTEWLLQANRDYHQRMLDLRPLAGSRPQRDFVRIVYELPFRVGRLKTGTPPRIVVGAGTSNDVAAALRLGYREVVGIDIDRRSSRSVRTFTGAPPIARHARGRRCARISDARRTRAVRHRLLRPPGFARDVLVDVVAQARQVRYTPRRSAGRLGPRRGQRRAERVLLGGERMDVSAPPRPGAQRHGRRADRGAARLRLRRHVPRRQTLTLAHVQTMYPEAKKGEADVPSIRMRPTTGRSSTCVRERCRGRTSQSSF
jgi:hypothetical protein